MESYTEYLPLAIVAVVGWGLVVAAIAEMIKQALKAMGRTIPPKAMMLLTAAACAGLTVWTLLGQDVPVQAAVLVACIAVFAPKFAHDGAGLLKKPPA